MLSNFKKFTVTKQITF